MSGRSRVHHRLLLVLPWGRDISRIEKAIHSGTFQHRGRVHGHCIHTSGGSLAPHILPIAPRHLFPHSHSPLRRQCRRYCSLPRGLKQPSHKAHRHPFSFLSHCHARDNQSHPRPKISPLRLVPLLLALVTDHQDHSRVTITHLLCHTASVHVPTTQPRTPQDLARMNTAARDQPRSQPCSPRLAPQHSPPEELAIATSLYLVPFHLCTLLFSFSAYRCPVPALYLSLYLLRLVI